MTKHMADKRKPSDGGRVKRFMQIAREGSRVWEALWRKPAAVPVGNRRAAEFLRIDRGRQV
ncbi:hypothetical protein [Gemmobacter caeruleus]|uniref:hypothetical protein n=1 Tax=Gemmobacter caeruleus TaxID=2595004 RepID=UPI0011EDE4AD|nr:hypothetical protein [Gemmobacter caeruleus]